MYNYYPNYYPNYQQQNYQQNANNTSTDERIWVQSEASAEAYLLAAGGFVRLWDSSAPRFYEKRADATGRPLPMEVYEYKRISPQIGVLNSTEDISAINEIKGQIKEITGRLDTLEKAKKGAVKNAKQSDADDTSV